MLGTSVRPASTVMACRSATAAACAIRTRGSRGNIYLKRALGAVVVVEAVQALHMQTQSGTVIAGLNNSSKPRLLRKGLEHVRNHLARQLANLFPLRDLETRIHTRINLQAKVRHAVRAGRDVDDGAGSMSVMCGDDGWHRERASSSGAYACPKRAMPTRDPSAKSNALQRSP